MAMKWVQDVSDTGKLEVSETGVGGWANVLPKAIQAFNGLAKHHGLGVLLTRAPTEDKANVVIRVSDGPATFQYEGENYSTPFEKTRLHGLTRLISRSDSQAVEKAFVFLPSQPQISTPKGVRSAGTNVLLFIAVHELLHACGLDNADHSADGVFAANPGTFPGDTASQDKITVSVKAGGKLRTSMLPPFFIDAATARTIQRLWHK